MFTPDEEGRILVKFIDLPHTATDGKDQAEAIAEAIDCLASVLSINMSLREEIPSPSRSRCGAVMVSVSLDVAPKLALYQAMRAAKIGNSELARPLGEIEAVVRRMLDPAHKTKAPTPSHWRRLERASSSALRQRNTAPDARSGHASGMTG
jgi:antitoxin HicB